MHHIYFPTGAGGVTLYHHPQWATARPATNCCGVAFGQLPAAPLFPGSLHCHMRHTPHFPAGSALPHQLPSSLLNRCCLQSSSLLCCSGTQTITFSWSICHLGEVACSLSSASPHPEWAAFPAEISSVKSRNWEGQEMEMAMSSLNSLF